MIPVTLFPCPYTDGARVVAEISLALNLPLYTDQMVLDQICATTGRSQKRMKYHLSYEGLLDERLVKERELCLDLVRGKLAELCLAPTSWFYFGTFSSLLKDEAVNTLNTIILANEDCRIERAASHEKISMEKATRLVRNRDALAGAWTSYLFNTQPYDESLYDLVVNYDCQDLMDVIGWICVQFDDFMQTMTIPTDLPASSPPELSQIKDLLTSRGINAGVTAVNGDLLIKLGGSRPFFAKFAPAILEWTSDIRKARNIRVVHTDHPAAAMGPRHLVYRPASAYYLPSVLDPA